MKLPEPQVKPERLPCVCCGRNLITVDAAGVTTYAIEPGRPVFVCAHCDAAAVRIADDTYGQYDDGEGNWGSDGVQAHEKREARLRGKFEILIHMAAQGYLGSSREGG